MHLTLHLTNGCNMNCRYCYVDQSRPASMRFETARKAIDMAAADQRRGMVSIAFFGGEPLLEKDLIGRCVDYCRHLKKAGSPGFHLKMTTNGLLLDDALIEYAKREGIFIALSHDGIREAHDMLRRDKHDAGTYGAVQSAAARLLAAAPYSPVMMTVNPQNVRYFADSVKHHYGTGFRYLICSLNYAGPWGEDTLAELQRQYRQLSEWYYELTMREEKFYFSPFDVKISSHISGDAYCHERCELGKNQLSIGPEGGIYPCVQFVGDDEYRIGDVDSGIDRQKRRRLYTMSESEKSTCVACAIRKRCNHYCGCLNRQTTGSINTVSPVLCAHERTVLPIADRLAARLYQKRNGMFIQKHYNELFPLLSFIEDKAAAAEKKDP